MKINEYTKKDGNTYYKFQLMLGVDKKTGKKVRVRRSGFTSKKEAQDTAIQLLNDFNQGNYLNRDNQTYYDIYKLWFDTRYIHDVRESTANKTRQLFNNHILKSFGKKKIQNITPIECTEAVNEWSKTNKDINKMKNHASKVFDFAINNLIINANPMDRVQLPKIHAKKREVNFYTRDELQLFLECAKKEDNPIWFPLFRLLAFSGMRKGEALGLQWKKINFKDKTITIDQTLTLGLGNKIIVQDTKTTSGNRVISMDDTTLEILAIWRKRQLQDYLRVGINTNKPTQYVFTNYKNEFVNPSNVTNSINRILLNNGLRKITTHQLRHTHASLLFEAGLPIKDVQERLGHSSYEITMDVYTHIYNDRKDGTAQKFSKFVGF